MRMIDYLDSIAPISTRLFTSNLLISYGIGTDEFEKSDLLVRYAQVRRFFGYSMTIDVEKPVQEIQEEIKSIFLEYEALKIKYPEGLPDPMKRFKDMSYAEISEYMEKNFIRIINISLSNAIVSISRFKRLSLKDALIARVLTTSEQIASERLKSELAEQKFWKGTIAGFSKDEVAPF